MLPHIISFIHILDRLYRAFPFVWFIMRGSKMPPIPNQDAGEHDLKLMERINLLELIKIAENTYHDHDLDTTVMKFGYDGDGLKIKAFKSDNSIIVAFKGTTLSFPGVETGKTSEKNKNLDEVLYSMCKKNDRSCSEQKIAYLRKLGYFNDAVNAINSLREVYRDESMLLTGHSSGGTIASLVGTKYNIPVIALSSAGDAYIANVLQIYDPERMYDNVVHVGMCNDVIFRGKCDDSYGSYNSLGYHIETKCHIGRSFCIKDSNYNSLAYHPISTIKVKISSFERVILVEDTNNVNCLH